MIAFGTLGKAIKNRLKSSVVYILRVLSYCFVLKLKYIYNRHIDKIELIKFDHILYKTTFKLTFAVAANNGNKRGKLARPFSVLFDTCSKLCAVT